MLDKLTDQEKEINKEFIHSIAFLSVNLKNLSQDIAKNGIKEKYKNGVNQYGYKDRTEVKTYNAMFKNYQSAMKQLNDLILSHENHYEEDVDFFNNLHIDTNIKMKNGDCISVTLKRI